MNILAAFNFWEGILWLIIALIFFLFPVFSRIKGNKLNIFSGVLFFLFGISDFIEMKTGAWWRPYWLLAWKAICLLGLAAVFVRYMKIKKN